MECAEFLRIHRIEIEGREIRAIADLSIGGVEAQAIILIPLPSEKDARIKGAFMLRAVAEEAGGVRYIVVERELVKDA